MIVSMDRNMGFLLEDFPNEDNIKCDFCTIVPPNIIKFSAYMTNLTWTHIPTNTKTILPKQKFYTFSCSHECRTSFYNSVRGNKSAIGNFYETVILPRIVNY